MDGLTIMGIPVVITLRDVLGLGGAVICLALMLILGVLLLFLEIAEFIVTRRRF